MVGAAAVVVAGVVLWRLSRATKGADMTQSNSEKTSVPKDRITIEQVQKEKPEIIFAGGERVYFKEVGGEFISMEHLTINNTPIS